MLSEPSDIMDASGGRYRTKRVLNKRLTFCRLSQFPRYSYAEIPHNGCGHVCETRATAPAPDGIELRKRSAFGAIGNNLQVSSWQ